MIYREDELRELIEQMRTSPETEVVEFKEAKNDYKFKEIGQYFSALSNEANIRGKSEGWLIFGISNEGDYTGSNYRNGAKGSNLQNLKKEIAGSTNERMTFLEIYELFSHNVRIIAFQIPPALDGIPTTWNNSAYARENESLCPLPLNKLDIIRSQVGRDWSKDIVPGASISDLDHDAIAYARKQFMKRQQAEKKVELLTDASDEDFLDKAGLTINGQITNTALILLGKPESAHYFDGFTPRITWTLYNADNSVRSYEHFDMPMLLAVDRVYAKIRNEKYRYLADQTSLFPDEVDQYDADVIKEIINNCIAHSDYRLRGKINIGEFEDHLVFMNEGAFIPETIEKTLEPNYKPPYYRNHYLCNAMVKLYMIDTNSMGIPMVYRIQRERYFPLPSYDLDTPNRVAVTIYGRILDKNYTRLLHDHKEDMDMQTVFFLDQIQKKKPISQEKFQDLKKQGYVEGRYPNIFVSYKIADITGQKTEYIYNKGIADDLCKQLIINTLKLAPASHNDIMAVLNHGALSAVLSNEQKSKKVTNLLQQLKKDGIIEIEGSRRNSVWKLAMDYEEGDR